MAQKGRATIYIKWCGNGSIRFDGVENEIPLKTVFLEDAVSLEVGKIVRVKWGGKVWRGEVVRLPETTTGNFYHLWQTYCQHA